VKVINKTRSTIIAESVKIADTPASRLIGLLKHSTISPHEALIITHTRSIHMFFMRFAIDVIFVDKNFRVVGLVKNIKPFRMSPYFWRAHYAIEAAPETISSSRTEMGDEVGW
jgi:uncharacterized membrane protein (UPF0127 family)